MTVMRRVAQVALTGVAYIAAWIAVRILLAFAADVSHPLLDLLLPLCALALIAGPVAAAWLVARKLGRRWGSTARRIRWRIPRCALWAILAGYALTAIVGVPAAQSRRDTWAVEEYKRVRVGAPTPGGDPHPYIRTYIAVPVLPCVILSYHEYQVGWIYGLGTFELAVWYGVGVWSTNFWQLWIS